ncbi:MAG: glucoamylase family protein [Gemmatimonadaceae bacterium]
MIGASAGCIVKLSTRLVDAIPSDDDAFLDDIERSACGYFREVVNPANGLVPDTTREGSPCSIAVVGFALSAYPIAVERGWMARDDAIALTLAALRFFRDSDQSGSVDATGYKGFYYHFLDMNSGKRVWRSELSMIDTALLMAGILLAREYFNGMDASEVQIRQISDELYQRVDWNWSQNDGAAIVQGWKPESGFLHYGWQGYTEGTLLYVLALGSPTHPITRDAYDAWTVTYQWENLYGLDVLYAGPLFIYQFSHAWLDLRGIQDPFMREKGSDYFENSARALLVQREYARRNPMGFTGYDGDCWGLTACDGPDRDMQRRQQEASPPLGYAARGAPYGPDDGTLAGWAPVASLPFAPELCLNAMRAMRQRYPEMYPQQRYASGFNPGVLDSEGRYWVSPGHYGLDQGIVTMMIENYRTEFSWRLMRRCAYVVEGLRGAGFSGGWL